MSTDPEYMGQRTGRTSSTGTNLQNLPIPPKRRWWQFWKRRPPRPMFVECDTETTLILDYRDLEAKHVPATDANVQR